MPLDRRFEMSRAPHLCTCGKIVCHSVKCTCQIISTRARNKRHDAQRPSPRDRGYDSKWREARAAYLIAHPYCVNCNSTANTVDHIIPHKGDKTIFWDKQNWQSLCTTCHNRHKQREEQKV